MKNRPASARKSTGVSSSFIATLSRRLALATLAALGLGRAEAATWDGTTGGTPGDGITWLNPLNWSGDVVPSGVEDLIFGSGVTGTIQLGGNQTANTLTVNANTVLGSYGDRNTLTLATGTVTVGSGSTLTLNSELAGASALTVNGGGKLFLNNSINTFTGGITVDGAGTQLSFRSPGILPHINNVGMVFTGRVNYYTLGIGTPATLGNKTVTLSNGGEYRVLGVGANPDGSNNLALGTGGGAINMPGAWQQLTIDDGGQISGAGALTKAGNGRISFNTTDYNLAGGLTLNGGTVELLRVVGAPVQTTSNGAAAAVSRFSTFSGVTNDVAATTATTINGGMLVLSNGTVSVLDQATVTLNGGTIATVGADHEIGVRGQVTGGPASTTLVLNGGNIVSRDAFAYQTTRSPRINALMTGSGTINLYGATNAGGLGGQGHVVFQRSDLAHTFNGTFVLRDYATIEGRANQGTLAASLNNGKTIGNATLEMNGVNTMLDMRDNGTGSNQLLGSYSTNNINITGTQNGSLYLISTVQSTANTGNFMNFGTLTVGDQRVQRTTNAASAYGTVFNGLSLTGNPTLEVASHTAFAGAVSAPSRTLTRINSGGDLVFLNTTDIGTLDNANGVLAFRGANGAFTGSNLTLNGGLNISAQGIPAPTTLDLNSNTAIPGSTAANHSSQDRISNATTVNMLGNTTVRLTSLNNVTSSETLGSVNITGGAKFEVAKTGTATAPVALTLGTTSAPILVGKSTVNYSNTGTLGGAGNNTTRIVLAGQATTPFLGANQFSISTAGGSPTDWVRYDANLESGVASGVIPWTNTEYGAGLNQVQTAWATGSNVKLTGTGTTLTGSRTVDTLNLSFSNATAQGLTLGVGNTLTVSTGGIIAAANNAGGAAITSAIVGSGGTESITAGDGSAPASLYFNVANQLDLKAAISDNNGQPVTLVKSGPGTMRLTHHSLSIGGGSLAQAPYTAATWSGAFTGGVVINEGTLNVHRGQFLNGNTITLQGGALEINHGVANGAVNSILPGWGNNIIVNANSTLGIDDNGESDDNNSGDNTLANLGSLTINGKQQLSIGGYGPDISFTGANFTDRATINLLTRTNTTAIIVNGAQTGSGFDITAFAGGAVATYVLGGGQNDTAPNTYSGPINLYGGTLRLNKANGVAAITDGAGEDLIINGGALAWGPGNYGDLTTTNNPAVTNNNQNGIANLSPAAVKAAGMNQIADTATVTMLSGTLGTTDSIQNEKIGALIMKSGTFNTGNSGEGTFEATTGTITGGAVAFNWATHLKFGTLTLGSGAPNLVLNNGFIARQTVLEVGTGGLNMNGQRIELSSGGLSNFAGAGAVLRLSGDVAVTLDPLNANSAVGGGIYVGIGGNMREFSNSFIDLMGGTRDFNIADGSIFGISALMTNGGFTKSGGGTLTIQQNAPKIFSGSLFTGAVTVNGGNLVVRNGEAFGTAAGGVTVNNGGTLTIDGTIATADSFTLGGAGANLAGVTDVKELGALVINQGALTVTGATSLSSAATIAPTTTQIAGQGAAPINRGYVAFNHAAGITGTGTLTLSGNGDGFILGGVNTSSGGLVKDGGGRWDIAGASTYTGSTTIGAGVLRISNNASLGATGSGTTVYGGAALELSGGISVAESLSLYGNGFGVQSGAVSSVAGTNTLTGAITLGANTTLRVENGTLNVTGAITGPDASLTLAGPGNGTVSGAVSAGLIGQNGIVKNGTGTWTLSGANSISGATTVNGGTLVLDYTTQNNGKVNAGESVNLNGGSLSVLGNAGAATTQIINGLNVNLGGGNVSVSGGATGATLDVGSINRTSGATVNFNLGSNGSIASSTPLTLGIIGTYATVNGTDWATITAGKVAAFSGYVPLARSVGSSDHAVLSASQVQLGSTTVNSVKISGGAGLALGGNNLSLGSGGLLYAGTGTVGISGTGLIQDLNGQDLVISTRGTLDIAAPIIGASGASLIKSGDGNLFLRATNAFTGSININGGSLSVIGNGTTHPTTLGSAAGPRNINLNGGTLRVMAGDYDPGANTMQVVVGPAGGTTSIRDVGASGSLILNDAGQFSGSGDLHVTGGGRLGIGNAYTTFTGNVYVDQGSLRLTNISAVGGRKSQVLTFAPGTALIAGVGASNNFFGLPNDIVMTDSLIAGAGGYSLAGDINFNGTNTIGLLDRDGVQTAQSALFSGRITGNGTLNVFGVNQGLIFGGGNGTQLTLNNSSNTFAGTINLKANTGLEARQTGSLGATPGAVTINMEANSRLLLRGPSSGDFMANVVVNGNSTINVDRMTVGTAFGSGDRTQLAINNLSVNNSAFVATTTSANNYTLRVNGTANFAADANFLVDTGAISIALTNGATFASSSATLNKYGAGNLFLFDAANNSTGRTVIHNGSLFLRGANGSLQSPTVELRGPGAQLYIDNGDAPNNNRLSDTGTLILGGGALRVNGTEANLGTVQAPGGHTSVVYNQETLNTSTPLTLGSSFTRSVGATLNFATDNSTLGAVNSASFRANTRILIPGQADVAAGDIIPWALTSTNEFARYDGTTVEGGSALGVISVGNGSSGNYLTDPAETNFLVGNIVRTTGTTTTQLTTSRTVRALKLDGGTPAANTQYRRLDLNGGNTLTVDRGVINAITVIQQISNSNATTPSILTSGNPTGEFFLYSQGTALEIGPGSANGTAAGLTGEVIIANNGATPLALVKGGTGTLDLRNTVNGNTFTGGVYINQGTLRVFRGASLGPSTNTITLNGGTLEIYTDESGATAGDNIAGLGHNIVVNGNATLGADNGVSALATNVGDQLNMGTLTVNGGYIVQIGGFDGFDWNFTGATFANNPILDLGLGRTSATADLSMTKINGVIAGSGFQVIASNVTASSIGTLQLAGSSANTYTGTVTIGDLPVQFNKSAGNAITGDLEVIGGGNGSVTWLANDQMADSGTLKLTRGTVSFGGKTETIAGIQMAGGTISTGNNAILNVTGDVVVNGTSSANGFQVSDATTVTVGGSLKITEFGRVTMTAGGTGSFLNVNGLEMTGSTLLQNSGSGPNTVRLLGNVTTFGSASTARLGDSNDSDTFLELNGARTFNVADGTAGLDLVISTVVRDRTSPNTVGSLILTGGGLVQMAGGGTSNSYTGGTTVNAGTLELFKSVGTNAIPGTAGGAVDLTIGDGVGGIRADRVIGRNSNQIADAADVFISSSGVLDLQLFNSSETVGSLAGSGPVDLGPSSAFGVSGAVNTVYSGSITGAGTFTKSGAGTLELTGISDITGGSTISGGVLKLTGTLAGGAIIASGGTLGGDGILAGPLTVNAGGTLAPSGSVGTVGSLDIGVWTMTNGTFAVELGGLASYDQVNVTGDITLGGNLSLSMVNGYIPTFGGNDLFFIAINDGVDAITGTFAGVPDGGTVTVNGYDFVVSYFGNSTTNSTTGGNDIVLSVPEPGSVALLLGGVALLAGGRRVRRRK